jgi:acetylornithine deacetylase
MPPVSDLLSDRDLLARLIAFDTTSTGSNRPLADFACEYLERAGVEIVRNESDDGAKLNVLALAGPSADAERRGLILCGHMDCVPAGDTGWGSDPFLMTEADGRYVGRGTCDMKGSVALAMNALASADAGRLAAPLGVLLTYDEEVGSLGAARFVSTWPADRALPRNVIVGEPTSMRVVRMHKGHLALRIRTRGRAAHTGSPHLGSNAIEAASPIIAGLARFARQLKQRRTASSRFFPHVPSPVLNISTIRGGEAINVIPDTCTMGISVRVLPDMNPADLMEWIRDTVAKSQIHGNFEIEVINDNPPMLLEADAEVHQGLSALLGQSDSLGVSFASDAGHLSKAGFDCVLFGPGCIEAAHRPNEYVPIDEFTRAQVVLEKAVQRFCF